MLREVNPFFHQNKHTGQVIAQYINLSVHKDLFITQLFVNFPSMYNILHCRFFLFWTSSFFWIFFGMAQDLPPIQNFGPLEYNGEYQNWAITQADSKKIYVANHSSLLEFDGVRWRKFSLPSQTIIRSVKAYGDRLYTGCYGEFGFWLSNAMGLLEYTSLSDKFKHQLLDNEEFWDILVFDTTVLFQSLERIYMYDLEADRLHIIEAKTEKAKLFAIGNNVYFQEKDKGLFTLENGKPLLISDAGEFQKGTIINIVERKNGLLIVTYDGHFYTYNSQQLERMDTDIDRLGL